MARYYSKKTPKVRDGKVQKKNRAALTPNYYNTPQSYPILDRRRPGAGYKHLIRKKDLHRFIQIIPDWDELAKGLNAVVLAPGEWGVMGWHIPGAVHLCAWDRVIEWEDCDVSWYEEHEEILGKLGVTCTPNGEDWHLAFTEATARGFQLVHVLVHELGHHHDRMTTRSRAWAARGEGFAEEYARRHEDTIIERYRADFDLM